MSCLAFRPSPATSPARSQRRGRSSSSACAATSARPVHASRLNVPVSSRWPKASTTLLVASMTAVSTWPRVPAPRRRAIATVITTVAQTAMMLGTRSATSEWPATSWVIRASSATMDGWSG